jgi:hypothetical protein
MSEHGVRSDLQRIRDCSACKYTLKSWRLNTTCEQKFWASSTCVSLGGDGEGLYAGGMPRVPRPGSGGGPSLTPAPRAVSITKQEIL